MYQNNAYLEICSNVFGDMLSASQVRPASHLGRKQPQLLKELARTTCRHHRENGLISAALWSFTPGSDVSVAFCYMM